METKPDTPFYRKFFSNITDSHLEAEMRLAYLNGQTVLYKLALNERINRQARARRRA